MLAALSLVGFLAALALAMSAALTVCFRDAFGDRHGRRRAAHLPGARTPLRVCVVLGSGGHTSEMLRSLRCLPDSFLRPHRLCYVVSATDSHSAQLARDHDQSRFNRAAEVFTIPRAREVGQSYTSSIRTTLMAVLAALRVVWRCRPEVLLVNGPGVCVPVVLASALWATVTPWRMRYPTTVYVESFTCVSHLSLTGKLLIPVLCDVVAYHWRPLEPVIAARQRCGRRCFIGPSAAHGAASMTLAETASYHTASTPDHGSTAERYAVLTVGSTHFDELVAVGVTTAVCQALRSQLGVSTLYVQHGTTPLVLANLLDVAACSESTDPETPSGTGGVRTQHGKLAGVSIEAFAYKPGLSALIAGAHIVLTHAGAGTILECLEARRLSIVVPNHRLMSDHQLELAEALDANKYLYCVDVENIVQRLRGGDINPARVRVFPGMDGEALTAALRHALTDETTKIA